MQPHRFGLLIVALTTAWPLSALAAPPAGTPYRTDVQHSHVEDATSHGIGTVNMITCIMSALRADALVNQGTYLALVDESKCSNDKDSASNSSGSSSNAPSYMNAVVQSTRGSADEPMRMKAWLSMPQDGEGMTVFVNLSATSAPTDANPYGDFRIDYCGSPDAMAGVCMMNGFLTGGASGIQYYEVEQGGGGGGGGGGTQAKALALTRQGDDGGSGRLSYQDEGSQQQFSFAYDTAHFRRANGVQDQCFSRLAQDADASVWRYGLYDADGGRVTRQSGFPIEYDAGQGTVRGYMGYWGLSVPGNAAAPSNGTTVYKVDYGRDGATRTAYTYAGVPGRLTKYSKTAKPLSQIEGVRFSLWVNDRSEIESGAQQVSGQYEIAWNSGGFFAVLAAVECNGGPCVSHDAAGGLSIPVSYFASRGGVRGFSQALGGELFIPVASDATSLSGSAEVTLRVQSLVYPGDMPANLACLNNCPTAESLQAYFGDGTPAASPYAAGTAFNYMPSANTVAYTTAGGLLRSAGEPVTWTTGEAPAQYMGGLRSGRLFTSDHLADVLCNGSETQYCDYRVEALDDYYVWETGPNPFNQFAALTDGNGAYVQFDAPLNVDYTVPIGAGYGAYAGRSLVLQYGGFGELWGVPGQCVSRDDNQAVSCDQQGARYVPAFVIPDDDITGRVTRGDTTYYAKWLDRELRFRPAPGQCSGLPLPTDSDLPLPNETGLRNTADSTAAAYIGAKPVLDAGTAPRVIHGEVKF